MQRFMFVIDTTSKTAVAVPDERGPYVLWEAAQTEIEEAYRRGYEAASGIDAAGDFAFDAAREQGKV